MSEDELNRAIAERSIIECIYDGRRRVGEPHLIGDEGSGLTLEIFQTSGGSERGGIPEWRHFKVDQMSAVVVTEKPFVVRSDFNPRRNRWRRILCSVPSKAD